MCDGVRLRRQHVHERDAAAAKAGLKFLARDRRNRRAKHPLIVARRADCTSRRRDFHGLLRNPPCASFFPACPHLPRRSSSLSWVLTRRFLPSTSDRTKSSTKSSTSKS